MNERAYAASLLSAWMWFWGLVLVLIGVLITFNISDTYFNSTGAPHELTTDAVITGLATIVLGASLLGLGVGFWMAKAWAWWVGTTVITLSLFADVVNFARTANALGILPDTLGRKDAEWPIFMWRESLSFLGTTNNDALRVGWPILVHLVILLVVVFVLVSPQVREAFGVRFDAILPRPLPSGVPRVVAPPAPLPPRNQPQPAQTMVQEAPASRLGYLIVQSGDLAGKSFQLRNQTAIGRSKQGNDIVLEDEGISREHAIVRLENQRFVFMDRGALNRSFLVTPDGKKEINKHILMDGDELLIGGTRLLYRDG